MECLVDHQGDQALVFELGAIIGSLAQFDANQLFKAGVMAPLFECLASANAKIVESSAKALRQMVQNPLSLQTESIKASHIYLLVTLSKPPTHTALKSASISISEVAVSILARLADCSNVRQNLCEAGGVDLLADWLNDDWSHFPRVQEAALDALASMCKSSDDIAISIAGFKGI